MMMMMVMMMMMMVVVVVIFLVVLLNALLRLRQEAKRCCCPFLQHLLLSLPPCSPARLCAWAVLLPRAPMSAQLRRCSSQNASTLHQSLQ